MILDYIIYFILLYFILFYTIIFYFILFVYICVLFFRVFVIRDGYLMLFEQAGDPQPILKLHNADCATLADAKNREFVITHKVREEE